MATRMAPDGEHAFSLGHLNKQEFGIHFGRSKHKGRRVDFYKLVGDEPVQVTKAEWREIGRHHNLIFEDRTESCVVMTHLMSVVFPARNRPLHHFSVVRCSFEKGEPHHRINVKTIAEAERVHDDMLRAGVKRTKQVFAALAQYGDRLLKLDDALRYEEGMDTMKAMEAWMDEHIPGSIILNKNTFGLYALCTDHRAAMHFKLRWL